MDWKAERIAARGRGVRKYDEAEVRSYQALHGLGFLERADQDAYLSDIEQVVEFRPDMSVLDVGSGTGTLCKVLQFVPGLQLTAMEPSAAMLSVLRDDPELSGVRTVEGGCDAVTDLRVFDRESFDLIISRQVVNGLYDPLVAFRNWYQWLKPSGTVVAIEGLYGREAWQGEWAEEVDVLPLSASQSRATLAYMLESVGFTVQHVRWMKATNQRPCTRTPRYVVSAMKVVS